MLTTLRLLTTFCLLGGLAAQTQNIAYADGDSNPASGSGNAFPFGAGGGIRYQAIFPHSLFGTSPLNIVTIRDILVAGNTTDLEAGYDDIEIKMGKTTLNTVTSDWNSNNPNPTTVYRGPLRIRFINNQWTGIGLPNPYLYVPLNANEHLCIEVIVWSAINGPTNFYYPKASGTLQRAFRNGWVTNQTQPPLTGSSGCRMGFVINDGNISVAGDSCMSSTNTPLRASASTWPQLGAPLSLNLQGAVATRPAFFVIGTKLVAFDLNVAGAPGCILWNNPLIGVPTVTDAAGAAVLNTTVPKNSTPGTIFGHWLVLDGAANAGGMTTSDSMTIIIGS